MVVLAILIVGKIESTNMESSRTWIVFSALSGAEIRRLEVFLDSPYHNQREDVKRLLVVMRAARKEGDVPEMELVWKGVYPGKPFQLADLRHLLNYFLRAVERFLVLRKMDEDEAMGSMLLAEAYLDHDLGELAGSRLRRATQQIGKMKGGGPERIQHGIRRAELDYKSHAAKGRSFKAGLQEISDQVDRWFAAQKLKYACTMLSQRNVFKADYELDFISEIVDRVSAGQLRDEPLVAIYFATYRMLMEDDSRIAFQEQIQLLEQYGDLLSHPDLRSLYLMSINFWIRQLNRGAQDAAERVYQLYQKGLGEGWLIQNNELSPYTYKNVVAAGLKLKEYREVGRFIEQYRKRLPEGVRYSYYQTSLAEVELAQGHWREVLRILRFVQHRDPLAQLRARIMQIKAGYELGEIQIIEYQLDNLRQLLRRRKELAYHREAYANFERFLRRLLSLMPGDSKQEEKLIGEIRSTDPLPESEWLVKKVEMP